MRKLGILFGAVAVVLMGCRADQGKPAAGMGEQVSMAAPKPPEAAYRPVIVCFGDSITAGYGVDPGETYPENLEKILAGDNYPYRVVNAGVSGNTTKDGLDRIARVIALHPDVVVLEFGGNDGLRGLKVEQTQANLASMIDQLQTAHAKVALAGITLPPSYGQDYLTKFNAMYPALAKQYKIPYLPFVLQGAYGVDGDIQADGIHPTDKGTKVVAANIAQLIEPLLRH